MKKTKKLRLDRQTIARLDERQLRGVIGGADASAGPTECCGNGNQSMPPKICHGDTQVTCGQACEVPISLMQTC